MPRRSPSKPQPEHLGRERQGNREIARRRKERAEEADAAAAAEAARVLAAEKDVRTTTNNHVLPKNVYERDGVIYVKMTVDGKSYNKYYKDTHRDERNRPLAPPSYPDSAAGIAAARAAIQEFNDSIDDWEPPASVAAAPPAPAPPATAPPATTVNNFHGPVGAVSGHNSGALAAPSASQAEEALVRERDEAAEATDTVLEDLKKVQEERGIALDAVDTLQSEVSELEEDKRELAALNAALEEKIDKLKGRQRKLEEGKGGGELAHLLVSAEGEAAEQRERGNGLEKERQRLADKIAEMSRIAEVEGELAALNAALEEKIAALKEKSEGWQQTVGEKEQARGPTLPAAAPARSPGSASGRRFRSSRSRCAPPASKRRTRSSRPCAREWRRCRRSATATRPSATTWRRDATATRRPTRSSPRNPLPSPLRGGLRWRRHPRRRPSGAEDAAPPPAHRAWPAVPPSCPSTDAHGARGCRSAWGRTARTD
jgi:hypothetical protein